MKIAVVTATYQRGDGNTPLVLTRAIESLKKQAHTDWKFFLIGDAYEDQNEFNSFSNLLPSNKIHTENLPISIEREKYPPGKDRWHVSGITPVNIGIERALEEGYDYVALLDHDDIWYPDHLQLINEGIEKTKSPFIFTRGYYKIANGSVLGIPYVNYEPSKFKKLNVNEKNPITLNYGVNSYPCLPYECIFLKTSVCLDCRIIKLRMRDCLEETGEGYVGDADWWLRIRQEMIEQKYKPALYIDHITCVNIDEGYSKINE
jgi:hypothetical protein